MVRREFKELCDIRCRTFLAGSGSQLDRSKIMRQVHNIKGDGLHQLVRLEKYAVVLQDKLGTFKGYHATLHVKEDGISDPAWHCTICPTESC